MKGFHPKKGRIGLDDVCELEIEMIDFENKMTEAETHDRALQIKDEGNVKFKAGDISGALSLYNKALTKIGRHAFKCKDTSLLPRNTEIRVILYTNIMMCYFQKHDDHKVIEWAGKILSLQPNHGKALYRRAGAYEHQIEFEKAMDDLQKMIDAGVNVEEATEKLKEVQAKNASNDKAMKESYGKIFSSK
eukprot:PhF_6_TR38675/c0_g1_i1/m.57859